VTERKSTKYIAVHCSATKPSMDIGEDEIRVWHKNNGWLDIGYNIVIRRHGLIEIGRPLDHQGAHVAGYNDVSLGICLIGGVDENLKAADNFTAAQWVSLASTLTWLDRVYPDAIIQGHRDFPGVAKDCPSFDVKGFVRNIGLRKE